MTRARQSPKPTARAGRPHECPAYGLCRLCGWNPARVPAAWLEEGAGAPYDGDSPLIGQRVRLRGDSVDSVVAGLATPLGGSLLQGNRSKRYRCQGSFMVKTPFGGGYIETPIARSVVRERMRLEERGGLCPDAQVYSSLELRMGAVRALELEAAKARRKPFDLVGELPFPHRPASSPCCARSPLHPTKLEALVEAYRESGEEAEFEAAREAVAAALPKDQRGRELANVRDLVAGVDALKRHCWGLWQGVEERAQETRKEYRARRKEASKERRELGLDSGRRARRATSVSVPSAASSAALGDALRSYANMTFEALPETFDPVDDSFEVDELAEYLE